MHPIDQRHARALESLGGGDVGSDHEFLDQPVCFEPFRSDDAVDGAVGLEQNLSLGQVEVERCALVAGVLEGPVGGVERHQHRLDEPLRILVSRPADCRLRLRVRQLGCRADQDAMKAVGVFAAIRGHDDAHRQRRPVLMGLERAEIVGDALRQHRHHAVGKIDRVAAVERRAVERRARRDIVRHIGDCDADHMAAGVSRIGIGRRMHGVVVILGVRWIDGDEGDVTPVLAFPQAHGSCRLRLLEGGRRKNMGNPVGVDRDQAHRALALDRAEPLGDAAGRRPVGAPAAPDLDRDEVAVLRAAARGGRDFQFLHVLLVDRREPAAAVGQGAEDAENARPHALDDLDDAPAVADRIAVLAGLLDPNESTIANARNCAGPGMAQRTNTNFGRCSVRFLVPLGWHRYQFTVAVASRDFGQHHVR